MWFSPLPSTRGCDASEGTPSSLSLRQRLFDCLAAPQAALSSTPSLDITHTSSAQELLPGLVLRGLEEEKAHSQRHGPYLYPTMI